jgi:hypothetical protein
MKFYIGLKNAPHKHDRILFKNEAVPTRESHGHLFFATIGPFRTKRGAIFMRDYGRSNPHCQTVQDAERLGKFYEGNATARIIGKLHGVGRPMVEPI